MFASLLAPPLLGTLVPLGSTPAATGSTLSNINVEVPATPPDFRGPPDTVTPPLQPPAPPSQPRGGSSVPAEEVNPYRRRGQDSGDTPETAAARRARDMLMRDHRRRERGGEEVSSTPVFHANPDAAERERRSQRATIKEPDPQLDLSLENWRDDPALSDQDYTLLNNFHEQLDKEKMETCARCDEKWFHIGLNDDRVCTSCINADKELDEDMLFLYSGANDIDSGQAAAGLEPLTQIEEMLIARVHCFVEVRQVRGVQYKYKGHVVNFLTNTPKVYNRLPLLPEDLDVILIRPAN
ncbi:hypothetical protein PTTW11_00008 [Pyrenophora teres f. teres]|uniref:DUF6570 domain-containing protein n=1 Tax=Pyrenophora teres f. teres TaxID=97479 RepID=A0A6S6V4L1_9PLEO|nr:hypothetical protein PTTW11_00008 [Pyrenophora teres f. teres]